jgi:hypothetical protein
LAAHVVAVSALIIAVALACRSIPTGPRTVVGQAGTDAGRGRSATDAGSKCASSIHGIASIDWPGNHETDGCADGGMEQCFIHGYPLKIISICLIISYRLNTIMTRQYVLLAGAVNILTA